MASYNEREDNPYLPETTRGDEDPLAKDEAEWGEKERAAVRAMFPEPELDPDGPCPNDNANCGGPGYAPVEEYSSRCSECHSRWLESDLRERLREFKSKHRKRLLDSPPSSDERESIKEDEREERIALLTDWDGWETDAFDFPDVLTENGR